MSPSVSATYIPVFLPAVDILSGCCVNGAMSSFNTRNLDRLGNQVSIPINTDEDGYLGRECPVKECLGYFKITPGTGIKGPAPVIARIVGIAVTRTHFGPKNSSNTQDQSPFGR